MKLIVDKRWCGNHGIGRFAKEMLKDSYGLNLQDEFNNIFKFYDPILLFIKVFRYKGWFLSPSYNAPLFFSSKSIITLHDLMHVNFSEYNSIQKKIYYNFIVKRVCKKSPLVFTVSNFSKYEIAKWAKINHEKIVVVYNGVDSSFNQNVEPFFHEKEYFFYIGDRKNHKNIKRLIIAYSKSSASSNVDLILSGEKTQYIDDLIMENGISDKVFFSGFIDEKKLPNYYRGALATLLPSLYEGFGLPIIESMAVGTPVLTSNITAMPEISNGACLLVDPYSVDSICNGIDKMYFNDDFRSELSKKGLVRSQDFNWDSARAIWSESIKKVLGENI